MKMGLQPSTETKYRLKKVLSRATPFHQNLFTLCLEEIFKKLEWNRKNIKIRDEHLNNLRFSDDVVLFRESANELQ